MDGVAAGKASSVEKETVLHIAFAEGDSGGLPEVYVRVRLWELSDRGSCECSGISCVPDVFL